MRAPWLLSLLLAALGSMLGGCPGRSRPVAAPEPSRGDFTRVNAEAGLRFRHEDGSSGRKQFPEVMGAGCALVDLTGDGHLDLYLVNGARLPGEPAGPLLTNRFYRGHGNGAFTDGTTASGLGDPGYGMGCCVGDYDNDGRPDLYVTNVGKNRLFRNLGDGKFADVTATSGVAAGGFSTGAAFADYDGDGDLDLYVARYVAWTSDADIPCTTADGDRQVRVYCRPVVYPAAPDVLYRNNGDGTFTDVTSSSGVNVQPGRGLGVLWSDVDEDGDQDLFVANDMSANFLFINQGNGRFKEEGLLRGVALGENGQPQASMGVAAVDYDGDGHLDLACTNFSGEYLALYRNLGGGHFQDVSAQAGLVEATNAYVGFGLGFPDLDLDGLPDLFVANGHVTEAAEQFYPGVSLAQPKLCLFNRDGRAFVSPTRPSPMVSAKRVGRGAAFGDIDEDGDVDILVLNWKDEPDLLRNNSPNPGRSLRLSLQADSGDRSGIGARIEVKSGDRVQVQELRSGGSYLSQSELTLTFGLGAAAEAETVRVRWPGGAEQSWSGLRAGQVHRLVQRRTQPAPIGEATRK